LALSSTALAEEGELQVGVATPVLLHSRTTLETKLDGAKAKAKSNGTSWGVGQSVLGEIGYGITPNLVVGGLLQLSGSSDKPDDSNNDSKVSTFTMLLGPKLDIMFLPGDKVQPFVGAVLGLSSASASSGDLYDSTATGFQLMGRAGIRAYPNSKFSIDPQLMISQGWASGETTAADLKFDTSGSTFQIGVLVGISGWI
jgi:hypothetical protein